MQYNVLEARNQLSKLIEAAEAGEEVIIARRGKPAVRMLPIVEEEIDETPGNPAWIAQWFQNYTPDPAWAMTSEEADAYLAEERASWD
jgi:prevent-host-death family protein